MDAPERVHSTMSSVLSLGCSDSGGSHVYIWRYSQNEQQGYYRTIPNDAKYSIMFCSLFIFSICNRDNSKIFIVTGTKNKRGSFRLVNDSQVVRDLLAGVELLLSEVEGLFTGRIASHGSTVKIRTKT